MEKKVSECAFSGISFTTGRNGEVNHGLNWDSGKGIPSWKEIENNGSVDDYLERTVLCDVPATCNLP